MSIAASIDRVLAADPMVRWPGPPAGNQNLEILAYAECWGYDVRVCE
jgi:hypothetical protein